MKSVSQLIEETGDLRANPAGVQRVVLEAMDQMREGDYDLVDPSNPFVFLLEAATATASAGMMRSEGLMRRMYPTLAQSEDELYPHMSDADFPNRFASPGRTTLTLLLSLPEIHDRAIDDGTGVRKLVIPRDTEVVVEGLTFTLQYPIEIRVMPHGGVQVVYDTSQTSPVQTLETNLLDWETGRMSAGAGELAGIEFLIIKIPMLQFKLTPQYDQLNPSSGFAKSYGFTDQFYHARVYVSSGENGEWEEIRTTHSEQVYDPTTPTAKLKVIGSRLDVSLPQIYFSRGMLPRGIRVDIYTTRGPVDVPLERYEPRSFQAKWRDLSKTESPFVAPIRAFTTLTMFSTERVRGGNAAIDFETLRSRVINNALGEINVPITPTQLEAQMDTLGYDIVKDVDNITNRIYLATRELPAPTVDDLSTAAGCTIGTLQESLVNLAQLDNVHDNGRRVTIPSGMLFNVVRGILSPLDNAERDALYGASAEYKAQRVNENNYAFTPFHYVLDTNDDRLECRSYYLDNPEVYTKKFVGENQTTRLEIATHRYGIDKTDTGYKIALITRGGVTVKTMADDQIHAQMSFTPHGEVDRAYLNGTMAGRTEDGNFVFEFHLDTNFDVDANDRLLLDTFLMYDTEARRTPIDLDAVIDVQYIASGYDVDGMKSSELDTRKGQFILPEQSTAIVQESLNVRFGRSLEGLWSRSRSVVSSLDYARYEADVPATYETVVYKRDPETGVIDIQRDPETGELIYEVLYNAGDPVVDGDGNPVYKHRKGDVKLDTEGNPISVDSRRMLRQVDLLLLEGSFAFATERAIQSYTRNLTRTVVDWVTQDIAKIQHRMLENTKLWYYPQSTLGSVRVFVEDGVPTSIDADQSFRVKFYLTRLGYDNVELRSELSRVATTAISAGLRKPTVSVTDMARQIREDVGDDVLDVVVSGLGGDNDYEMLSLQDDSTRLGIRKRLEVLPTGDLSVRDAVSIEFVRHRS